MSTTPVTDVPQGTPPARQAVREVTPLVALIPVFAMILFLGGGYIWLELPAEPMIIASAVVAGIIAIVHGHTWDDIQESISQKIGKTWPALMILICVGMLIGTWMVSGTIPLMIYWGLKIISPQFLALTALLVTTIIAVATGTSWGSAGTIGVAFMGVAMGMNANLAMVAGAVVAGAYFGDKMSPLSDTTNITSMATRVNLYTHIANLLWTTGPAYIITAIVFTVVGLQGGGGASVNSEQINSVLGALEAGFNLNPLLLLPVLIVLIGSVWRKPTVPVMLVASLTSIVLAVWLQGSKLVSTFVAAVNGFSLDMITRGSWDEKMATKDLIRLLERGGMNSMMGTLLICFCALAFAGTMDVTKSLNVLIDSMLKNVKSVFGLVSTTIVTCLTTIGVTCNGQISVIMPGEVLRPAYIERGVHPKVLGRTCEDAATVIEPIMPWTAAGAYMAATLGVATVDYLPWAVMNWAGVLVALVLAATGIGITTIDESEKAELLAQQ